MKKKSGFGSNPDFLEPLRVTLTDDGCPAPVKIKPFGVIDIESKAGDTQEAGFTRPFLVGFLDVARATGSLPAVKRGEKMRDPYLAFRDEPHLKDRPWRYRHMQPGGCIDKLFALILNEDYNGYNFYAHYGGGFDYLHFTTWLTAHRDEFGFEIIPVQSSIQVLRVWRIPEDPVDPIRESWDFLDSHKILPMPLADACATFKIPGKLDHDLHMHEDDPRWEEYLKQDCKALGQVMECVYDMAINRLGGDVGITAASTAMKLFRRKYMGNYGISAKIPRHRHWAHCKLKGTRKNPGPCIGCAHDWIRRGYYGGRTEIIRMFGTRLNYFDINSSYVAAMFQPMPIGSRIVDPGPSIHWARHHSRGGRYAGFCECTVYIPPECPLPPLPHKDPKTGKLMFPTGQFHGVWSLEELALLDDPLVNGEIRYVSSTVWFKLEIMFEPMVNSLWALRDPTRADFDEGLSAFAKLLGNSTYGKFAMCQERTSVVFRKDVEPTKCFLCGEEAPLTGLCNACQGSKPAKPNDDDFDVWYQAKQVDAPYIIPHVASHITAYARVALWNHMRTALMTAAETSPVASLAVGDTVVKEDGSFHLLEHLRFDADEKRWEAHYVPLHTYKATPEIVRYVEDQQVRVGGKVFYCDTDSIVTNVVLPTSSKLGGLKNEHPGDELNFFAIQPKVYLLERAQHNARVEKAHEVRRRYVASFGPQRRGEPRMSDEEIAEVADRIRKGEELIAMVKKKIRDVDGKPIDPWKIDPIVLKPFEKVTMKGFPPRMRTKENLEHLRGGRIDWDALREGRGAPTGEPGVLSWTQLEKVRSLARNGFVEPPQMREGNTHAERRYHAVSKSFQSKYDKRETLSDGSGRTRAKILAEPMGGLTWDDDDAQAAE